MRIGIVTGEYPPMVGGVGAFSQILACEFARQGHWVSVFSSREAQSSDAQIHLTNSVKQWNIGSLVTIRRWAQEEQPDIINLQFQTAAFGMSPWIHFLPDVVERIPVVTTFHDLRFPYLFPKAGKLRNWIVARLAKASDGVILTNHEDAAQLQQLPKVALIPIGSNILNNVSANFDAEIWREKAGANKGDLLLAYFGLLNRSKGIETLLESLAQLRAENIPARLVMIGGGAGTSDPTNEAFMREIQLQIETLGLSEFVQQTGFLDEESVSAYLTASDAVLLPFSDGASYRRGSLMAAIRYGCAIITTTPQASIPMFKDGENMILTQPGNSTQLTQAIRKLHLSQSLRQTLQQGASELASHFEWTGIAQETVDFYRLVVEVVAKT